MRQAEETAFYAEVKKRMAEGTPEAVASKITKKAISAFSAQIAGLKAKLVDDETIVEDAEEALVSAIYPKTVFSDNKYYCSSIARAQEKVDAAKENLAVTQASLDFFEGLLAKVD